MRCFNREVNPRSRVEQSIYCLHGREKNPKRLTERKVNVYNMYASTFTGKKTEKQAKNDAFHALLVIKGGGKTPDNHQQASGTCWEAWPPHTPLPTIETYQRRFPTSPLCTGGRYSFPNQLLVGQVRKAGITGHRALASRAFFNDSWQGSLFWQDPMSWQESYRILKEVLVVALCRPNLTI